MSTMLHADFDRGPRLAALALVGCLSAFLVLALVWMSIAKLDISVHAMGQVTPSSKVQLIQSLEGGIVREISVQEGQSVKRNDLLAYVENLQYSAEQGEDQHQLWAAQAAITRLDAELAGRTPDFAPELEAKVPDLVAKERSLWLTREKERNDALETAQRQLAQRQQELVEAKARIVSFDSLLASSRESLAMEEKLTAQGAGARADFLRAQQEVTRVEGDLEAARTSVPRLEAAIAEGRSRVAEVLSHARAESSRERSKLAAEAATLTAKLTGSNDRVARRELRSPMDGVVNRLLINTVGGVAKAGETIMELVPVQDTLLVTARVKPSDIAFIRPGQDAIIGITAYDSSIFGRLDGKVLRVGADAIADTKPQSELPLYFEVVLETDRNYLGKPEERLVISSGMAADASIHTGKRTLMEYMLKPVIKTFDKALRER
ncbi:MAG: HlyD family type I secretion periplasmic adaptor subunit [Gammaproteobacteria bacterium]|nr:HlyD family type I secretion periplasmic adaptor subunit [Gammaproteobacteria bacterium]